jgi:hypothetical protein
MKTHFEWGEKMKFGFLVLFSLIVVGCGNSNHNGGTSQAPGAPDSPAVTLAQYDQKISSTWKLTSRTTDRATNTQEFASLAQEYPEYLSKFDPSKITSAEIDISIYSFIGSTTCTANDPRLTFLSVYYDVCEGTAHDTTCEVPVMIMPTDRDPCYQP